MTAINEVNTKEERIRALMQARGVEALWLRRINNFAWATGGASSFINIAAETGLVSLLYTPEGKYALTTNIEGPRVAQEDKVAALGFEMRQYPWHEPQQVVAALTNGLRLGADGPVAGAADLTADLLQLRLTLTPDEQARFRGLGKDCGEAVAAAARRARPGMTEYEIAGVLAEESLRREAWPVVNLVATDERIFNFRHPLPTGKTLDKYAMVILCGRRGGLTAAVTRLAHFGPLPAAVRRKADACLQIDATFIAASQPGARLSDVFRQGVEAYANAGYADEWRLHHQGGLIGYEGREIIATFDTHQTLQAGMACAWNPSITGTKTEDTVLLGPDGIEVLTESAGWPVRPVTALGQTVMRPDILVMG